MGFDEDCERPAWLGNAVVGVWTFLSASFLARTDVQRADAALVGTLVVAVALGSLYRLRGLHWVNIGLGVWLFGSTFLLGPRSAWAVVNDVVTGTLVFGRAAFPWRPTDVGERCVESTQR